MWYSLTFTGCRLCGNCCRKKEDYIPLTIFDLVRMYDGFHLLGSNGKLDFDLRMVYVGSIGELMPRHPSSYRYSLLVEGWVPLPCLKLPCNYLDKKECSIHGFKPLICVSFPYHLPGWREDDSCALIRELAIRKRRGLENIIPDRSKNAICMYSIARSVTMYQLNLPLYFLDENGKRLVQKGGFRELIQKSKNITTKTATQSHISNWISKHFTYYLGADNQLGDMYKKLKSTISVALEDTDFKLSNIALMDELAKWHFTSARKVEFLLRGFWPIASAQK